jgi:hypothetical protein
MHWSDLCPGGTLPLILRGALVAAGDVSWLRFVMVLRLRLGRRRQLQKPETVHRTFPQYLLFGHRQYRCVHFLFVHTGVFHVLSLKSQREFISLSSPDSFVSYF